jgi:riboflavin-specific deaminase-like protein
MSAVIDRLLPDPITGVTDEQLLQVYDVRDRPWLRVNFVSSLDGAATIEGLSGKLGGEADKRVFDLLRRTADVVLVGAGTVRAEGYGPMVLGAAAAAWRREHGRPEHPVFAIVSGSLDLDPASAIFAKAPVRPIVITTSSAPDARLAAFEEVADVIVAGSQGVDIHSALSGLRDRGLLHVLNEGGPSLFASLLASDAVDELCLTLSPLLAGGIDAPRITHGDLEHPRGFGLDQVLTSDGTLLLRYLRAAP